MSEIKCFVCRDEGLVDGCPNCGLELSYHTSKVAEEINASRVDELQIPKFYKSNEWRVEILQEEHLDLFEQVPAFDRYCQQLDKCMKIYKNGAIPNTSALVCSPPGFSKTTWAYSCILEAFKHGHKVMPMIDTSQLKRMLLTISERPTQFVNYQGIHIDRFMQSDVLFLSVSKGPEYEYAYEVILNVLDIRSRMDLPTIIISDFSVRELAVMDEFKRLQHTLKPSGRGSSSKFPIVVEYSDLYGGA